MDSGNAAWMMISAALVLFMIPGLALFYGGMDRSKNVLNMLLMNMYCVGVVPLVWVTIGYTLAASYSGNGWLGNLDNFALKNTEPGQGMIEAAFLMAFAAITPALISGAVADRMKFSTWAVFVPVWSVLVYSPVVYWIYALDGDGNLMGFLGERGSIDFAGGTAIHINAGIAALALSVILGKRKGWPKSQAKPHSLPLVMLGTGILWFGWFGFNAGSAFEANETASQAFMNTFLAASAAMFAWLLVERVVDGHFTTLGAASGIVAGLVAITPAAGSVAGMSPIWIGFIAGAVCYFAVSLKYRFGFDDSLDVVGVHMVGGIVGGVLIGFFANSEPFGGGFEEGLFYGGGADLLIEQVFSIVVVMAYSLVVTSVIAFALKATMGLRVDDETESVGLDTRLHAETAYNYAESGAGRVS
jgi:Amt family ammonium transporter